MRSRPLIFVLAVALLIGLWPPLTALAAVQITRSELNGGQLRIEGQGAVPNATMTVDGVARGSADSTGRFRIEATNFSSPTCRVAVSDGATSVQASLTGCTPSTSPTPTPTTTGATGSISIVPGGGGSGSITSQPAGINCVITLGNGAGTCSAFFPAGTVVRLDARPASDSQFQGWRGLPGCSDPSKIGVFAGTNINCQPGFALKF
jgi:hypothetical protein